ncbi:MAG: hypothetical protein HYV63_01785 [Candidatus Schekmanbacteria bacterium]|nr:hypothetical protein [Candidatus Schekmanbacteria bacterium]
MILDRIAPSGRGFPRSPRNLKVGWTSVGQRRRACLHTLLDQARREALAARSMAFVRGSFRSLRMALAASLVASNLVETLVAAGLYRMLDRTAAAHPAPGPAEAAYSHAEPLAWSGGPVVVSRGIPAGMIAAERLRKYRPDMLVGGGFVHVRALFTGIAIRSPAPPRWAASGALTRTTSSGMPSCSEPSRSSGDCSGG